jgi:hypothetical protein
MSTGVVTVVFGVGSERGGLRWELRDQVAQVFRGHMFLASRGLLLKIGLPYRLFSGVSLVLPDSLERP